MKKKNLSLMCAAMLAATAIPANFAMASAARCPNVYFFFPLSGLTDI